MQHEVICMKLFIKPFEQEVFGKQTLVTFPYPREDMYSDSIFPYLVFDGGAFFFLNDRLNAQDSDRLMTLLEQGKLFEPWSQNGEFDWDSVYKHPLFASAPIFEQHVWIQRLYFLLPLAHRYGKTGDKKFAALWLSYLKDWWNAHPYQPYEDISYLQTDLVWRDMQVAWRTLMLCYSIYFLGEHNPFALADWQIICAGKPKNTWQPAMPKTMCCRLGWLSCIAVFCSLMQNRPLCIMYRGKIPLK